MKQAGRNSLTRGGPDLQCEQPSRVQGACAAKGRSAWMHALLCATPHYFLLLILQLENIFLYVPPQLIKGNIIRQLPALQLEFLLATGLLTVVFRLLYSNRHAPALITGTLALVNVYVLCDQVFYRLTFQHFRGSQIENSVTDLLWLKDSIFAVLDGPFLANLIVLIATCALVGRYLVKAKRMAAPATRFRLRRHRAQRFAVVFAGVVLAVAQGGGPERSMARLHLGQHPIAALAAGALSEPSMPVMQYNKAAALLREAKAGVSSPVRETVNTPSSRVQAADRPYNVVLIVLESIGSKQLLKGGRPDPVITPFLYRLTENGIVYDAMYAKYPATVVSNVAISTGGASLTWGKVENLRYAYTGATLAGEFNKQGFATGLFSSADLEFGHLGDFFRGIGFDRVFDYGRQQKGFRQVAKLNSWGADDGAVLEQARLWALRQSAEQVPFYLRIQTNLAHHPYNIPVAASPAITHPDPQKRKYLNAVHYLDSLLSRFYRQLQQAGLTGNTLFVVTGDHGEAFAQWHVTNLLHRNHLYEENIRSFLIIANRNLYPEYRRSSVSVSHGDIMPTLLALNGYKPPVGIQGGDLRSEQYRPAIQFFHKNNHPEAWGLRKGRWKYIATFSGDEVELYDLHRDPDEQLNLSGEHPRLVSEFQQLLTAWYVVQNNRFVSNLKDSPALPGADYQPGDFSAQGPTALKSGYLRKTARGEAFTESRRMNPGEALFAWTKWISYREARQVDYALIGPDGAEYHYVRRIGPDDVITQTELPVPRPRVQGIWQLRLMVGKRQVLSTTFELSETVALKNSEHVPVPSEHIRAVAFDPGTKIRHALPAGHSLRAGERLRLDVRWPRSQRRRIITFKWRGPSGQRRQYQVHLKPGQIYSEVAHNGPYPMQPGVWWLSLWERGRQISSKLIRLGDVALTPRAKAGQQSDTVQEQG